MTGERIDGPKIVNNITPLTDIKVGETSTAKINSTWGEGFSSNKGTFGFTPEFAALFGKFEEVEIPQYPNGGFKANIKPTADEVASMAKSDAITNEMTDDDLIFV